MMGMMGKKYYAPTKLSENIRETPEGYLLCLDVPIGRVGEMKYARGETPIEPGPDGVTIISRTEEELFSEKTIASFEGKSFTINHPGEFVNSENWQELTCGVLQNVRRGEADGVAALVADILVTAKSAIELIKNGLREVSCGYEAEYEETGPGQGIQKNITGNHLALVDQGRAGSAFKINDSAENLLKTGGNMKKKLKELFAKFVDENKEIMEDESSEKPEEKKEATDAEKIEGLMAKVADLEGMEERLKKLEEAVSKILEAESAEAKVITDEDEIEEEEEYVPTGDTASRAEILAPGIELRKGVEKAALEAAYKTAEGKEVIDSLTGGKGLTKDAAFDTLFVATSEVLKSKRKTVVVSSVKDSQGYVSMHGESRPVSIDEINEINRKFYGVK